MFPAGLGGRDARNRHPSDLVAAVPGQTSQYSTMPVPRCDFNRVRDIWTDSSNGSFAILFMATTQPRGLKMNARAENRDEHQRDDASCDDPDIASVYRGGCYC